MIFGTNPIRVIRTIATVVSLVERLFSGKKNHGARKKQRAMKLLTQTISPAIAPLDRETIRVLAVLVDLLGEGATKLGHSNRGFDEMLRVWSIVNDTVTAVTEFVDNPEVVRDIVVDFVVDAVDIPLLDERMEAVVVGMLVDFALEQTDESLTALR